MRHETLDIVWLNAERTMTRGELLALTGLGEAELSELLDCGAVVPLDEREQPARFTAQCVASVRRARRLREELELEPHALGVAVALLERIAELESEVRHLRAAGE